MENFIVSARKYRPAKFNSVVGQETISNTLKNAIKNNHVAQAFLFTGPRGVGKTTCARILAKALNCTNLTSDFEPCDECESCKSFNSSASMNIYELDAASNNSVDAIRSLVEQVRIPPQGGKYKVYIIDEVHMLSSQAFNAFLKTLEEPPAYAKFILATTEKHKIIPTILSRCQIFDFRRIVVEDISKHLQYVATSEKVDFEPEALNIIAQKADGSLRDALSIFDQMVSFSGNNLTYKDVIANLNVLDYDYFFRMIDLIKESSIPQILLLLNEIYDKGFDGQHFITGLSSHIRNLMVARDASTLVLLETSNAVKQKYQTQAQIISIMNLMLMLKIANNCDFKYRETSNKRLSVELSLMQMAALQNPDNQSQKPSSSPQNNQNINSNTSPNTSNIQSQTLAKTTENKINIVVPKPDFKNTTTYDTGILSIKKQQNTTKQEKTELNSTSTADSNLSEIIPLNKESLELCWIHCIENTATNLPAIYEVLKQTKPNIDIEKHLVIIEVKNVVQLEEINEIKLKMTEFLRNKLNNSLVSINVIVNSDTQTVEVKYSTDEDRFTSWVKENNDLLTLKKRLGLDIN